jgi:hypothetical protein
MSGKGGYMSTLLVGYDLNTKGQKYKELIEFLKAQHNWWHHLDSTWIVMTTLSASDFLGDLVEREFIDDNDEVFVGNITGDPASWIGFNDRGSKWLKGNL